MKILLYSLYFIIFIYIIIIFQLNNASSLGNNDISSDSLDSSISFIGSFTFDKDLFLYNYNNFLHSTILPQLNRDNMTGISAISAAAAAIFAAITAIFAAISLRKSSKVNEAQIYLSLRDLFSKHEEIQKNLKGGKWNDRDKGPITEFNSSEESSKVDSYLRFFEYCDVLIENKVISLKTFNEMYGPYIYDIKRNHQIMQTIEEEGWILFPKLLSRLDKLNK